MQMQTYKLFCELLIAIVPYDRIVVIKSLVINISNNEEEMFITNDRKDQCTKLGEPTTE